MKSIYKSKLAWLGAGISIEAVLELLQSMLDSDAVPAGWKEYIQVAVGILIIVLRWKTTQSVFVTPPSSGAAAFALAFLLPALAIASPPKASITGPSGGVPGDAINLDASKSSCCVTRWDVVRRGFAAADTHFTVSEDGRSCQINSYPGVYDVTLSVANEEGIDVKRHVVVIWGVSPPAPQPVPGPDVPTPAPPVPPGPPAPEPQPTPVPPTPPGPEPTPPAPAPSPKPTPPAPVPEPTFPDGKFGAAKFVYEAATKSVPAGPQRAAEAVKLAGAWEGVGAAISAGTVRGVLSIRSAMVTANQTALGADGVGRWKAFGEVLAAKLSELYMAGSLKTADDWAGIINEGAAGLRAVK